MAGKNEDKNGSHCAPMNSCCTIESIVSVDDRGQMVLPKEIRDKAGICAGDKLAIINWNRGDEISCISLIKVDALAGMVKDMFGPLMKEIIQS